MDMIVNVLLLIIGFSIWAGLHSLTAGFGAKDWARRRFGPAADRWYRLAYHVFAGLSFLPLLVLLAALPDRTLYALPYPWAWLMQGVRGLALLGAAVALLQTDPWHFAGLAQLAGRPAAETGRLVVRGFYCRVRHPIYFFSLLLVWLTPAMTFNWLLACLLITAYFYLGSLHEERRLLAEFGQAYAEYRQKVPMLVPRPGRCIPPTN